MQVTDKITITNEDNMLLMARYPDNYFDLAIVDPPYGININNNMGRRKGDKHSGHKKVKWDNEIPSQEYFNELFRVSKNQIIWGGNYFPLPLTGSWLFWDKLMPEEMSFSMGELAWMTFGNTLRKITLKHHGFINGDNVKIHPTQKPVALYKWILDKYAKQGDKILDTHLGSGSIAIACHDYKFELTACELDKEYFDKAIERISNHVAQQKLF
jgi:site-specific DNA-methyltransferase (adenine-specific)